MESVQEKEAKLNQSNMMTSNTQSLVEWPLAQSLECYKVNNEMFLMEAAARSVESFNLSMKAIQLFGECKFMEHAPAKNEKGQFDASKDERILLSRVMCKQLEAMQMPATSEMKKSFINELQKSEEYVQIFSNNDDFAADVSTSFECYFVLEQTTVEINTAGGMSLDSGKERLLKKLLNVFNELTEQVAASYYDAIYNAKLKLHSKCPSLFQDSDNDDDDDENAKAAEQFEADIV